MPKKEFACYDCDAHFTISYQGREPVSFCPFCGTELELADSNEYEEDEE